MNASEVRTQFAGERRTVGNQRGLAREPVTLRDARESLHDEELAPEHRGVAAQEQRLRRGDTRCMRDAQHGEFLRTAQACRHARWRIGAQHERVLAVPWPAADVDVEQKIVLDRATGQPFVAGNAHILCASCARKPARECGRCGSLHRVAQRIVLRQFIFPLRMRLAMLQRWTSEGPS